ncbi:helix-turn-helix transcriptional regulator [Myxococcaceae bacterium JPH2]|nr:helix-turn-helix transcriptional regulator [Myxococcaceae bacterium JPH2]
MFAELNTLLREPVGFDGSCWHGTDPATGLVTSTMAENLDPRGFERAAYLELWAPEPLTFAGVRASGRRVDTMHRASEGQPERSTRFVELLAPAGFCDELRVNFDLPSGCWGAAVFMRAQGREPFRARDLGLVERLAPHIGQMLRRSYLDTIPPGDDAPSPGIAVLGPSGKLLSVDPRGEAILSELAEPLPSPNGIPTGFISVAEHARGAAAAGRPELPSRARVRTHRGQWFTLHASLLEGRADGQVAIVMAPATPSEMLPMALMSLGLTLREQDVAVLVMRGHDTATIAQTLFITPLTVQDHMKAIFTKAGVRSRRAFVARLIGSVQAVGRPPPR